MAEQRLVRVFVWKQGAEPNRDYIRQILRVAAPEAVPDRDEAPLLAPVVGRGVAEWPEDFWSFALPQMRQPIDWTDRNRYDIAGWQGNDSRSNEKLFVVSVYDRAQAQANAFVPREQRAATPQQYAPPSYGAPQQPQVPPGVNYGVPPQQGAAPVNYGAPGGGFPAGPQSPPTYQQNYNQPAQYTQPPQANLPEYAYPGHTGISLADTNGGQGAFYSGFGPRLGGGLIDFVIVALLELLPFIIAVVLLSGINNNSPDAGGQTALWFCLSSCVWLFVAALYYGGLWLWRGQTLGMMLTGTKLVNEAGAKPDFGRVMLRLIGYVCSFLTLGFGFLMIALDPRRQGLHDRMASTYVVPTHPPTAPHPASMPDYAAGSLPAQPQAPAAPVFTPPAQVPSYTATLPQQQPTYQAPIYPAPPQQAQYYNPPVAPPAQQLSTAELAIADTRIETGPTAPADEAVAAPPGEAAPVLFRRGLDLLAEGQRDIPGSNLLLVEQEAAQAALASFSAAATQNPQSAAYRFFMGVSRRYSADFAAARPDFDRALQLDPNYWDARMQLYFNADWHDAFAYPEWSVTSDELPQALRAALPQRSGVRLAIVREGGGKTVVVLGVTQRASWKQLPNITMPARVEVAPIYSPFGPALALYVAVRDNPQDPYRAETFLNPSEAPQQGSDATMLGQNLLLQLARQTHTYLIFVDEKGALLMNRYLFFDQSTLYMLNQMSAQVQAAAAQAAHTGAWLPLDRFQQAAQWHMERFQLKQIQI